MKSKKSKPQAASPLATGKLKLNKETLKDLSPKGAGAIKGGAKATATWDTQNTCCWVAREVYGEDDPRWLMFRAWLLGDAPSWFRGLYLRHGERFARWLAPHAAIKSVIRAWMDSVIEQRQFTTAAIGCIRD